MVSWKENQNQGVLKKKEKVRNKAEYFENTEYFVIKHSLSLQLAPLALCKSDFILNK